MYTPCPSTSSVPLAGSALVYVWQEKGEKRGRKKIGSIEVKSHRSHNARIHPHPNSAQKKGPPSTQLLHHVVWAHICGFLENRHEMWTLKGLKRGGGHTIQRHWNKGRHLGRAAGRHKW